MAETQIFPTFTATDLPDRMTNEQAQSNRFTQAALERHKREGILLAVRARWITLAVVAVLLWYLNPEPEMLYYYPFLAASAFVGWLQTRVGRVGRSGLELAVLFLDVLIFVVALTLPNPFQQNDWPAAMVFRFENFNYMFIILALATLSYSWRTIMAVGNWTCLLWLVSVGLLWWFSEPSAALETAAFEAFGHDPDLLYLLNPNSFNFDIRIQNLVIFLIVAFTLGFSIRRFNRLILGNAALERERANLSRYFSPNVVEELSNNDEPLKQIRTHDVAVIFVDIKGFTRFAAERSAEDVIRTLRSFHGQMEAAVFAYGGTLDKYLGDGLMATFGTPVPAEDDLRRAYLCTRAMLSAATEWNAQRVAVAEVPLNVSIGLHNGPVVLGDIGGDRLEFAVIGNTVNVASRIEGLSRPLGAGLVISDDAYRGLPAADTADLEQHVGQMIAGLDDLITVWARPAGT